MTIAGAYKEDHAPSFMHDSRTPGFALHQLDAIKQLKPVLRFQYLDSSISCGNNWLTISISGKIVARLTAFEQRYALKRLLDTAVRSAEAEQDFNWPAAELPFGIGYAGGGAAIYLLFSDDAVAALTSEQAGELASWLGLLEGELVDDKSWFTSNLTVRGCSERLSLVLNHDKLAGALLVNVETAAAAELQALLLAASCGMLAGQVTVRGAPWLIEIEPFDSLRTVIACNNSKVVLSGPALIVLAADIERWLLATSREKE